jgi:beta-glucosidase
MDAKVALRKIGPEVINSPAHSALALEVAEQAIVLLKSEPAVGGSTPLLPLDATKLSRVAFIGPHSNSSELLLGNYFGRNTQVNSQTPLLSARAVLASLGSKAEVR